MSTKRYGQYKDSEVEWLGKVPSHWRVDRLKASIQTCRNGIWGEEALGDENDIPCVRVADFDRRRLRVELSEPTVRNVTEKERVGRVLRKGDLLLEKSGGGENQPVGCVVLYDDARPAVCSNFVARMVAATGQDSSYWRYVHAAAYAVRLTVGSINQTSGLQNLDQDRYFNEYAAFPPQAEQAAIAAFLDREAGKIDTLVEEQRRLIELLKEKRQALISRAVTKGLDPSAPMRDSGVEWLGTVPAHWAVMTFQRCVHIAEGQVDPRVAPFSSMLLIAPDHVESRTGRVLSLETAEEQGAESGKYQCLAGDVIYSKIRPALRKACLAPSECLCSADMYPLRGLPTLRNSFLLWFLLSECFSAFAVLESERVAMPKINRESLKAVWLAVPPLPEQDEIDKELRAKTAEIDALVTEAESAVGLLAERRSALISAAVTGKIDVRGLVPQPEAVAA
jgi:type I restriction enzyme S subunit